MRSHFNLKYYLLLCCFSASWMCGKATEIEYLEEVQPRIWIAEFFSDALGDKLPFAVILPSDRKNHAPESVLFLLHGHGRNHLTLIEEPEVLKYLLDQPYLVILPFTKNGWYTNSTVNPEMRYGDAMDELIGLVEKEFNLRNERSDWAIAGWSMGGFGAVSIAERQNDRFGFAASIIGLLDFPKANESANSAAYQVPTSVFGDDQQTWNKYNPINKLERLENTPVFLVLGEQAFDYEMNKSFIQKSKDQRLSLKVHTLQGGHTQETRNEAIPLILREVNAFFQNALIGYTK